MDFYHRDVQKPILGADFLKHVGLMVDMQQHRLADTATHQHIQGVLSPDSSPSPCICPRDSNSPYLNLLSEFPSLTNVSSQNSIMKHNITHPIETTGPPISACLRQLAPERLKAGKLELEHTDATWHYPSLF